MQKGKVTGSALQRSIYPYTLYGAPGKQGFPGAFFETAEPEEIRYRVYRLLNRTGAEVGSCAGIQAQLLLPLETEEQEMKEIMKKTAEICDHAALPFWNAGGEVRSNVTKPQILLAGFPERTEQIRTAPRPGMQLVQIGPVACEGTVRLLARYRERLGKRFCPAFLEGAEALEEELDKRRAAELLRKMKAAGIHAVTEGGIFAGLWEISRKWRLGFEADLRKILIRQETVEICEILRRNPYCLAGNGCLLACAEEGEFLAEQMREQGYAAAVIGRMTEKKACILHNWEEIRYLDRPAEDEIYREEGE